MAVSILSLIILHILPLISFIHGQSQIITRNRANSTGISCDTDLYPNGCEINCGASESCSNIPIYCGALCIISCTAQNSCYDSFITSKIDNISIILYCAGEESCKNSTINIAKNSTLQVVATNEAAFHNATIHTDEHVTINIECSGFLYSNQCTFVTINGQMASSVNMDCLKADCNNIQMQCPYSTSNDSNNCRLNCNPDDEDDLEHECVDNVFYLNDDGTDPDEPGSECFLCGWNSASTVVFVIMMGFGILVILIILCKTLHEKYMAYKSQQEQLKKRWRRRVSRQRTDERKKSLGLDMLNENNKKNIYSKNAKLSGSYYVSPKAKNKKKSSFDESDYKMDKPPHINTLDELDEDESYSYRISGSSDDGFHFEEGYENYAKSSIVEERENSRSKSKSKSSSKSRSSQRNKRNKTNKSNKSKKLNQSNKSNKSKTNKSKKNKNKNSKKKQKNKPHADTPIRSKKNDEDPPPLIIQPIGESDDDDDIAPNKKKKVKIKIKTKIKNPFSPKKLSAIGSRSPKSTKSKKSSKSTRSFFDGDSGDDSTASNKSQKRGSKKSKKNSIPNAGTIKKSSSYDKKQTKSKKKKSVKFANDGNNNNNDSKRKRSSKKEKKRSQSKPVNKMSLNDKIPRAAKLTESKSVETSRFRRNKKKNNKNDKNDKKNKKNTRKTKSKSNADATDRKKKRKNSKNRKKSEPAIRPMSNKKPKLHEKTSSLISLGGLLNRNNKKGSFDSDDDEAPKHKRSLTEAAKSSNSYSKQKRKIKSLFTKKDAEIVKPTMKNEAKKLSSPIYRKRTAQNMSEFMWEVFYASQVYGGVLFHAYDIAADFAVIIFWIESGGNDVLIVLSIIAVMLYKAISSLVLARQFGWQWGIIQFLDLTIYVEAYRSLKNKYCTYTRELKWIRRMEAIFESSPQALLQLRYLMESPTILAGTGSLTSFDALVITSFISSLLSIAFSVARDDEAYFEMDAFPFLVPVWRWKLFHNKEPEENHKKKQKKNKNNTKKSKNSKNNKKDKNNKSNKKKGWASWVAMHELKSCYDDEDYVADPKTIWIMNWKYVVRFTFRLCEVTARILAITLLWIAFGGIITGCLLAAGFVFYFLLQSTGLIGYEWGNAVTFLISHPNLTLRTDRKLSVRRLKLVKFLTVVSGWYPLNKYLKFDMVETHFIHRAIETSIELSVICVGIYGLQCCGVDVDAEQELNTKAAFEDALGIGIMCVAWLCVISTPLLLRVVTPWMKEGQSLENNLFGLISGFDKTAVISFLKKSQRAEQLLNSQNQRGYTPLLLATEIGFYDIYEVLLEYGADINGQNKRGETAVHVFAKASTMSKKAMARGLNKLIKLNADFGINDAKGWSPTFHACENGNTKFIDYLCAQNAQALLVKDFDDRSIAHIAAVHNQWKFLKKLEYLKKQKKYKVDLLTSKDEEGRTPLHYAFEHQSAESIKVLIQHSRESINTQDNHGDNPLNAAAQFCDVAFFQKLKEIKLDLIVKFRNFLGPVCVEGNEKLLVWLLKECSKNKKNLFRSLEKWKDEHKRNPIHYCCMNGHHKLLPILKKYKFPMNETDSKGRTPAFFAAQRGHLNCLKQLEKYNAQFKIMNSKGISPFQIAQQGGHDDCCKFLRKYN